MNTFLEVIVTSVHEALEAQAGGADRLEILSSPETEGLTPSVAVVKEIVGTVSIPARVMLRNSASMVCASAVEAELVIELAAEFGTLPIDGLVAGFVKDGAVDEKMMFDIAAAAPNTFLTFHRAFDTVQDQHRALTVLRQIPTVNRLLTNAGAGTWRERIANLSRLQNAAGPKIKIVFAPGSDSVLHDPLSDVPRGVEVHVGRGAREPQTYSGAVSRERIAALKRKLNGTA